MKAAAVVGAAIVCVMLLSGPGWEDQLRRDLVTAGCRDVLVDPKPTILAVSSRECVGPGGELLDGDPSMALIADVVWAARGPRFDLLDVSVFRTATEPDALRLDIRRFSRDELGALHGPRPRELDREDGGEHQVGQLIWLILPIAYLAVAVGLTVVVARLKRSGLILMVWTR